MSSQAPPDGRKESDMGQSMRNMFRKAKDSVKRRASPQPPSRQLEHLTPLSPRPGLQSLVGRRSPVSITGSPASESDQPTNTLPPRPSTQDPGSNATADVIPEQPVPESEAWTRLTRTLRTLETSVKLFPPLHRVISSLIGCLDIVQAAASNRKDYEEMVDELESIAKILAQDAEELALEPTKGSVANITQCIERQVADIKQKGGRGAVGRLIKATQDQEDVIGQYRQIERLLKQLQCDLTMRTKNISKKHFETTLLKGMSPVDEARYNSSYSTTVRRRGCTAETREAINQTLKDWTTNPESEAIYWMNGMAGTGKTTIAYSFCRWLESMNRLGGSFFCSRISSSCRSLSQIVPTLAYQLAHFSPAFRSKLCTALNDAPDAGKLNVMQQFEALINQPMLEAKDAFPDSVVVVIDALDECDDNYSVRLLLDVLLKFADQLPVKFFVSSRPEYVIRERMVSQGGATRAIVHLHDIEQSIVEEDIKKYLTEAFTSMTPPPTGDQIATLAKQSRNLFIYAATVVRFIHPEDIHVDSTSRLESMLEAISDPRASAENRYEDLDRLYTTVLSAVFHPRLQAIEKNCMQIVLWTVVCAKEPMTVATISSLARLGDRQVWSALQSLRSVIHVPEDHGLISTLHASFPEYMLDESRSKEFTCHEFQSNNRLVHRLFDIMRSELRFNICELESSYDYDSQAEDLEARVTQHISPPLSYSCRHWSAHILLASPSRNTRDMLTDFLTNRLLFWMEVLSLCRCVGNGALMLQQAQTWLREQADQTTDEIQKKLSDARNFVTWFAANPCSRSTPHIYISALPSCAKSNWVHHHYSKRFQGLGTIEMDQRDEAILAIWNTQTAVNSIAVSPDGSRVAAGTDDGSIQLYDMNTAAIVLSLKGHKGRVWSVAFSPDGSLLASGSNDGGVIIWDTHTGHIKHGLRGEQTGTVFSVAFSPDGKRLVSGSADRAVRIWDVRNGVLALGPLQGHSKYIPSVLFSPDGRYVVSGSNDSTIRLWDALSGATVNEPLTGHTNTVYECAISPNGSILASCSSDKTIRMWDIPAGTSVGQPLDSHGGGVTSLAFSSDGTKLVSAGGSDAKGIIIMVWDTQSNSLILGPIHGHTATIWSITFSPDGTRVISGSEDSTIRVWDVMRDSEGPAIDHSREPSVGPIAFSLDRTRFISASSSGALHTWDMRTGTVIPPTLQGAEDLKPIQCIAISPQGKHAAAANDLAVHVWDALTGAIVSQHLVGHTASIKCLAFSPDGTSICSGSDDCTLIVWNIEAGTMIGQPYRGHTGSVCSVTYSPDGTLIVSGASDKTIRAWDPATSTLMLTFSGHDGSVESVGFSPDGRYIISGSDDKTIRKWDLDAPRKPLSYKCDYRVHFVSFSSNGTRVVAGSRSRIWFFNSQITELLSELSLPNDERFQWAGFCTYSNDIISTSISVKGQTQQSTEGSNQQTPQAQNIIRVWRAGTQLDPKHFSETGYWSLERDGRVLSPEGFVAWIPPDILRYLGRNSGSRTYYNPFVLLPDGIINLEYKGRCIGYQWAECYIHND